MNYKLILSTFLVSYLLASFIELNLNFLEWSNWVRLAFVLNMAIPFLKQNRINE